MKPFTCGHYSQPQVLMIRTAAKIYFFGNRDTFFGKQIHFFLTTAVFLPIFATLNTKNLHCTMEKFMDKLTEAIIKNDGLSETETEAKAKLNLIYIKMGQSEVKAFVDEFIDWLMTEKKLNYKAILQTPDSQLHDMFISEFKH